MRLDGPDDVDPAKAAPAPARSSTESPMMYFLRFLSDAELDTA